MKNGGQVVGFPEVHSVEIGFARQQSLADEITSQPAASSLMMWRCRPALLVTRSETRLPHFEDAAADMQAAGWPVVLRKSGGGACPVGPGTVQVSKIEAAVPGATMNDKYAALAALIQSALSLFHIAAEIGSVAGAYCPGRYDLAVQGKKIAGMSQHWFRNRRGVRCVVTSASINIDEPPDVLAGILNRFYSRSGSLLRCEATALTNIQRSGGVLPAGNDLAAAFVTQFASNLGMPGRDRARLPA